MKTSPLRTLFVSGLAFLLVVPLPVPGWASDERKTPVCDPEDGGIELPKGFCAVVVADDLGPGRHLAVRHNGDIYLRLQKRSGGGSVVALRDTDGDGKADVEKRFGDDDGGTGIAIRNGFLWVATAISIHRWRLDPKALVPRGRPETVIDGFPKQKQHEAKTFAFDDSRRIYVNVGAPSNACQKKLRSRGSPGLEPCPQLERQAGIWRFPAGPSGQTQKDGSRFATGIRGAVAIAWNHETGRLYAVQHGRDSLHEFWPDRFTAKDNARLPAEELIEITENDDFGWPYCYFDHHQNRKVLAPEYGGDGKKVGRCERAKAPLLGLPAHWAPNDMLFYRGDLLGDRYRGGAFVAFHGSWNRAPFEQQGYNVVFVPFGDDGPADGFEVFASGFPGKKELRDPGQARFRPTGLAEGPDGSLYVADSTKGRVWRVIRKPSPS